MRILRMTRFDDCETDPLHDSFLGHAIADPVVRLYSDHPALLPDAGPVSSSERIAKVLSGAPCEIQRPRTAVSIWWFHANSDGSVRRWNCSQRANGIQITPPEVFIEIEILYRRSVSLSGSPDSEIFNRWGV